MSYTSSRASWLVSLGMTGFKTYTSSMNKLVSFPKALLAFIGIASIDSSLTGNLLWLICIGSYTRIIAKAGTD